LKFTPLVTYMGEAERFDWLIAMDDGKIIATGNDWPAAHVRGLLGQRRRVVAALGYDALRVDDEFGRNTAIVARASSK
jgi:hypothetical protein